MLQVMSTDNSSVLDQVNLGELQKKLESMDYFGTISLVFKHGKVVTFHEERVLKPFEVNIYFK